MRVSPESFLPAIPFRAAAALFAALFMAPLQAAEPVWTAEALYKQHCAACHGERGDGMSRARSGLNPPPRGFTDASGREALSRERMIRSVTEGRPGTAMVGWGNRLTAEQIEAIVDHVRARFMGETAEVSRDEAVTTAGPVMAVAGSGHPESTAPATAAGESAGNVRGREVYKRHCASCHGDRGTGASWTASSLDPPPRDFSSEQLPRERMRESVRDGRPGTAMMAFGSRLGEREIDAVIDFIRSEFMVPAPDGAPADRPPEPAHAMPAHPAPAPHAPPAPDAPHATPTPAEPPVPPVAEAADMDAPLPDGLDGDPRRGGRFYMENCHVCHGRDGDGRGERASFIHPEPRDFTSAPSRRALNRPALYKAIAAGMRGTVMPAWRTVLSEQEIADIAEFVFQAYIDPQPGLLDDAKKKARP